MDEATPLWQQMIEASDEVLTRPGELEDPDAAIAAAHLQAVRERLVPQLRTANPRAAQRLWELLTDEILATIRPRIATKSKGGPAEPPNHAPSDATVGASGGEAEAPPTNPRIFRS